jgi:glycosyltransferase involved in cell wall biosynthesis
MGSRVLFVAPNVPYPLVSGGHLRDWQILSLLARRGLAPALLYFGAGEGAPLARRTPVDALASSVTFGGARIEAPDGGVLGTALRKLSYVTGAGTTHPFAYQYDAIGAGEAVVREATRVGAAIVVLRSFWCHEFPRLRAAGLRIVANCPDSNTRLAGEMVRSVANPAAKMGPLCNLAHVRRLEERFLGLADEIWVPTASERDEVVARHPIARCLVMPNLVDVAAVPDLTGTPSEDDALLFVGSFGYAPNENAARRLVGHVLPVLRRVRPAARLVLAGAGLSPRVRALAERVGGVETPGFVADLEPLYRRAAVVLLPVREGAGMLYKTIEGLALGKAVAGYPEAFRGIDADAESAFLTARTDGELAERVAGLLADGTARRMLGARARALASTRLSFEHGLERLAGSILADVGR